LEELGGKERVREKERGKRFKMGRRAGNSVKEDVKTSERGRGRERERERSSRIYVKMLQKKMMTMIVMEVTVTRRLEEIILTFFCFFCSERE
jgi:hypothetical protein